jgi:hypothetical protein
MLKEPIISGNFKGMAVIQIFRNNSINTCTSISKWIETDHELLNSMMLTCKSITYIESESDGNIIKLYDNKKEQVINTYTFNTKHGLYLNSKFSGSVECLNLVDYIDESEELEQPIDIYDFIERLSEQKSLSRSSFTSVISANGDDDSLDGIFIFRDVIN